MSGFASLQDFLQSETFYELMQTYRFALSSQQDRVVAAFENVKTFILGAAQSAHGSTTATEPSMLRQWPDGSCMNCGESARYHLCPESASHGSAPEATAEGKAKS